MPLPESHVLVAATRRCDLCASVVTPSRRLPGVSDGATDHCVEGVQVDFLDSGGPPVDRVEALQFLRQLPRTWPLEANRNDQPLFFQKLRPLILDPTGLHGSSRNDQKECLRTFKHAIESSFPLIGADLQRDVLFSNKRA